MARSNVPTQEADKGRAVNIGIRPEDFRIAQDGENYILEATVDYVERLGEVTLLYFVAEEGAEPLIAKLPGIHKDLRGNTVRLTAEAEKVHMFSNGQTMRT